MIYYCPHIINICNLSPGLFTFVIYQFFRIKTWGKLTDGRKNVKIAPYSRESQKNVVILWGDYI